MSFLFYFIFKLYIIVLVLPNIKMNPPQVYMCSFNSRTRHIFISVYFNLAIFHHTACLSAYMCFVCLGNFIPSYWGRKMATHSSTLAWKIPCTRSLIGYSPWGPEESDTTERLHFHISLSCIGEGNSNPLQCSSWRIPGMGEAGGLPSMGSHRVRRDWRDLAAAAFLAMLFFLLHWGNGTFFLVSLSDFSCCAINMQRISVY